MCVNSSLYTRITDCGTALADRFRLEHGSFDHDASDSENGIDMIRGHSDPLQSPSGSPESDNGWPWEDYSTKHAAHFVERAGLSAKQTLLLSDLLLDPKFNASDVCGGSRITKKRLFEPVKELPQTVRDRDRDRDDLQVRSLFLFLKHVCTCRYMPVINRTCSCIASDVVACMYILVHVWLC